MDKIGNMIAVMREYDAASRKHPKFNSAHEGYAVILEEVRELEAEVFRNPMKGIAKEDVGMRIVARDKHNNQMREEAVQIAAMCFRFLSDVV